MRPRTIIAFAVAFFLVIEIDGWAQLSPLATTVPYYLQSGSQLLIDCPVCAHLPIPVAMDGSFQLRLKEANPLFGTYELLNISFHAGATSGPQYTVTGSGTYQYGGAMGMIQNAYLDVSVDDGLQSTECYCANPVPGTGTNWPSFQINVIQTNGTPSQAYQLKILAAPGSQFVAITPDLASGNLRLELAAYGNLIELQRASTAAGPYLALAGVTNSESFTDVGALRNRTQFFYRLRQK